MLRVEDHGGLAVAWNVQDKQAVERELQQLSRTLFLDPELDPEHGVYWTVKEHIGSGQRPITCVVWRDEQGRPKPLTFGIVEQVKRQEGALDGAVQQALRAIDERNEKRRERAERDYHERVEEHLPRIKAAGLDSLTPYWRPRRFGAK